MSLQQRPIRGLLAGLLGGTVAWVLIDRTSWFDLLLYNPDGLPSWSKLYWLEAVLGAVYGLAIAVAISLAQWKSLPSHLQRIRAAVLGAAAGSVGGFVGIQLGQWAYNLLIPTHDVYAHGPTQWQLLEGVLARSAGWALIGLAIGAMEGVTRGSSRSARLGAIGGFTGGMAGGGVFEALETVTSNPSLSRLVGFVFLGAAIGFFLELVPYLMKQAWIRIESGKGSGSEFLIEKSATTIGRSELADISLFGNPKIAPIHCRIVMEIGAGVFRLLSSGDSGRGVQDNPIQVDGKEIGSEILLIGGESILIGDRILRFQVRSAETAQRLRRPISPRRPAFPKPAPAIVDAPDTRPVPKPTPVEPLNVVEAGHVASSRRIARDGHSGTRLVAMEGPYYGQTFALATRPKLYVGRSSDSDVALTNDKSVSRRHIAIHLEFGRHQVEDLGSSYGTTLNDIPLAPNQPAPLETGDVLKLGETMLKYE